jgi:hypothetical protein
MFVLGQLTFNLISMFRQQTNKLVRLKSSQISKKVKTFEKKFRIFHSYVLLSEFFLFHQVEKSLWGLAALGERRIPSLENHVTQEATQGTHGVKRSNTC